MVKGLKSLIVGTALLSLAGCVTYTTTSYPAPPIYPVERRVIYTESVGFSIRNVPSHPQGQRNFSNPSYNGWDSRSTWNDNRERNEGREHHQSGEHHYRK